MCGWVHPHFAALWWILLTTQWLIFDFLKLYFQISNGLAGLAKYGHWIIFKKICSKISVTIATCYSWWYGIWTNVLFIKVMKIFGYCVKYLSIIPVVPDISQDASATYKISIWQYTENHTQRQTCTHTRAHTHTRTGTYLCTHVYVCMHLIVQTETYTHYNLVHVHRHTRIVLRLCVCIHRYRNTHAHIGIQPYAHG